MKRILQVLIAILVMSVPGMMAIGSLIQSEDHIRAVVRTPSILTSGNTVKLFYGMDKSDKDLFCENSIVPVFRKGEGYYIGNTEVGKIKVTKNLNDRFLEGVVVEGRILPGDIAMQSQSECQIKPLEPNS